MKIVCLAVAVAVLQSVAFADAISDVLNPQLSFVQSAPNTWTTGSEYCSCYYSTYVNDTNGSGMPDYNSYDGYISYARTQSFSCSATNVALTTTVSGPGKLAFMWKCSYYGGFGFYVNGESNSGPGYSDCWCMQKYVYKEDGNRTFKWQYDKPVTSSTCYGYLANVTWEPAPTSFTLKFNPCGGSVSTVEKICDSGSTYGTLPTPTRNGYSFDGWYTMAHGGIKITSTDFVDWEQTTVYAHWTGGSLEKELSGVATNYSVNEFSNFRDFGNGMTTAIFPYASGGGEDWVEAQVEGESILSFDWIYSVSAARSYYSSVEVELLVDGESVREKHGEVRSSSENMYLYDDGWFQCSFPEPGVSGVASLNVKVFLPPGSHTVRWCVRPGYSSGGESYVTIANVTKEPAGTQSSIFDFVKFVQDYGIWRPGDMAHLHDNVYGARITANPNDYEARILRAATKLGALVDSPKAREIIASCGYAVADYTFKVTGEFVGLANVPQVNDVIDEMMPEILAAVDSALDDLKAIPEDWTGRIEFRPENYGYSAIRGNAYYHEDKVYIGLAEVSMLRAAVEMFRAQLNLVKGYDYAADYQSLSNMLMNAEYVSEVLAAAPKAGSIRNPTALLTAKEDFRAALESVKRADAAIMNRGDYDTYLFEYDITDAAEIAECRKILNQVEASLDAPTAIDLTYFGNKYDTNGVARAKIPGGDYAKQLFLGAVFAGNITRDLVPEGFINRDLNRVDVHMQTIADPTIGGLLPWLTLNDIARYYPLTQEWEVSAYLSSRPQVALRSGQDFIAYCLAERNGNLAYSASVPGVIACYRDWTDCVDFVQVQSTPVARQIPAENGHVYSIHFTPNESMSEPAVPFAITESPIKLPDGGPYVEVVDGVEITFEVVDGEAWIGTSNLDQGVDAGTAGTVTVPATLGGHPVVGIRAYAFFRCKSITALTFYGDEPAVEDMAFLQANIGHIYVTRFANWQRPLPVTWQGFPISYIAALNPELTVTPSQTSGTFSGSTTLALSAADGCTIRYTLDGSEPTKTSAAYSSPIAISSTKTVKFFAVEDGTGDWGPVSSVTLTRVASETDTITVTPSVADGTRFVGSQSVSLSAGSGKTIYYTTDGSDPKTSSTRQQYIEPIYMTSSTTLKYYAVDNAYGDWSPVQTARYILRKSDGGPYSETVNGLTWKYTISSGVASLYGTYSEPTIPQTTQGAVDIPAELGGCPVRAIGEFAFSGCSSLRSVAIPAGVTTIDLYAFADCSSLQSLTLPAGLTTLVGVTFAGCPSLQGVYMLGDAPSVRERPPFSNCGPGCKIYVKKGTSGWGAVPGMWGGVPIEYLEDAVFSTEVGGVPWNYRNDGARVSLQRHDRLGVADLVAGAVTIPSQVNGEAVKVLGKGLLQGADRMTSVVVPAGVTDIEGSVFRECTRLQSVALPEGLASIGDNAFRECTSLASITIPSTVTNIGYFAFRDCLRLTNVALRGEAPRRDLGAFMGVPAFTTISGRLGAATAIVYASVTNATPEIEVPAGWLDELAVAHDKPAGAESYQAAFVEKFGSDLNAALTKPTGKFDLKGNPLYVWQDYVAGTDPLDEEDQFTATLTIEDGVPVVKWSPELPPAKAALRKYTTYGATALNGEWVDVSAKSDVERQAQGYQFFRVSVELRK